MNGVVGGLLGGLLGNTGPDREKLVHEFRVRCDVAMPEGPKPAFPDFEEHRSVVPDGQRGCLETCERQVIDMAGLGVLRECIGVAYRDRPEGEGGGGDCRFWSAEHKEHEFLPVDKLPSAKGRPTDGGRWQVIYM